MRRLMSVARASSLPLQYTLSAVESSLAMGIFGAWILFEPAAATLLSAVLAGAIYAVLRAQRSLYRLFHFREDEATTFENISAVQERLRTPG